MGEEGGREAGVIGEEKHRGEMDLKWEGSVMREENMGSKGEGKRK